MNKKQINGSTGNAYHGENQAVLNAVGMKNEYKSNQWMTFRQANQKGLSIIKGQHGTSIVKMVEKEVMRKGKLQKEVAFMHYKVFNLDQMEAKASKKEEAVMTPSLTKEELIAELADSMPIEEAARMVLS